MREPDPAEDAAVGVVAVGGNQIRTDAQVVFVDRADDLGGDHLGAGPVLGLRRQHEARVAGVVDVAFVVVVIDPGGKAAAEPADERQDTLSRGWRHVRGPSAGARCVTRPVYYCPADPRRVQPFPEFFAWPGLGGPSRRVGPRCRVVCPLHEVAGGTWPGLARVGHIARGASDRREQDWIKEEQYLVFFPFSFE